MPRRAIVVLFLVSLSRVAVAQEVAARKTGIFLAASAGWGVPAGKVGDLGKSGGSSDLSDAISGWVPFALELGYRMIPHLSVSATFQYGFGLLDRCSDCSSHDLSGGANLAWHSTPVEAYTSWVALGVGYERLSVRAHAAAMDGFPNLDRQTTLSGIQFLNLRVGGDVAASPRVSMGAFAGVSLGRYGSTSGTVTIGDRAESVSADIEDPDVHAWFTLGLRCRFDL
jgi:hypothetical protein